MPRGAGDDVGEAEGVAGGQGGVLGGGEEAVGDAGRVEQFPEEVGGVGVGVAGLGGADARVEADEEDEQVGA